MTPPVAVVVAVHHHRGYATVEVRCPYCGRRHTHGASLGLRLAHCHGERDHPVGGYRIVDPDQLLDGRG